jgi:hypothetical protein
MATVKTTVDESGQRRVITKLNEDGERRVSCSCCGEELTCCVFPASCGIAPAQIEFYGETLTGNGTTFGDTTNGVILESDVWAVYRNGIRSERDCLGLALPGFTTNVAAVLATSYTMSFDYVNEPNEPISYVATLTYDGRVSNATDEIQFGAQFEQCSWTGSVEENFQQIFDEGLVLFFNKSLCAWQIADKPLGFLISTKTGVDQTSPVGNYGDFPYGLGPTIENIVIS